MKPLLQRVSITIDADILEKIKALAEENDRSFSSYVNLVLRRHLRSKEERDGKEKQAGYM